MLKSILPILLTLVGATAVQAQVIYSEPAFPTPEDEVTVFFNASEGNGGLEDCGCDIYLHTGVITNLSSSPSDWRYVPTTWGVADAEWQMTPVAGEDNLYSYTFSPSVEAYYNVPGGETVEQMAFVFRDGSGNQTGRATGGGDIFLDLFEGGAGFTAVLQSPASNAIIAQTGETIPVRVAVSEAATLTITDNGEELISTTTDLLEYDLVAGAAGTHLVEITIDNGEESTVLDFAYAVPLEVAAEEVPAGLEPGVTFENGVLRLNLFAPGKEHIFVLGSFNDYRPLTEYQMTPSPAGNWWIEIDGLDPAGPHTFQYLVDGRIRVADPYSRLVLDPGNDPFISEEVYPELPPYPDNAQGIVTLVDPQVAAYDWQVDNFDRPPKERLVVYELLVRDFLESHSYTDLIDTLDYLKRLGINAIELMPVNEFEGNISWGYNPSFHMALDKYYGPIYEFKRLVDVCHQRGLAVIIDVVYNHAFSQSPLAQLYWDENNFRPTPDNPWLNEFAKHPFNVGYDFNHESPHTRAFVKRTMRYWLEEMRVDGFRFDLSKGFTQVETTDVGAWSAYDPSRLVIINDYADEMWETSPGSYAIMEHLGDWAEEVEMANYGEGMLMWNNMQPQYKNAVLGFGSNLAGASYTHRGWDVPAIVSYMESHDEERLVYEALEFGSSQGDYNVRDLETALDRVAAGATMFYTIPGPKMLWQFGELGYDFSINYCEDGSINQDCRTGPKPIRWDFLEEQGRRDLYETMSDLILVTQAYDVFHTDDIEYDLAPSAKVIKLRHESMDAVAVANFGVTNQSASQVFTQTGTWYEFFSGEAFEVITPNQLLPLEPGAYRLYTTEPLEVPTNNHEVAAPRGFDLRTAPNPTAGELLISFDLPRAAMVQLEVMNLQGQTVHQEDLGQRSFGWHGEAIDLGLPAGSYVLRILAGNRVESKLIVVQ